jgi:hypothetical protein
MRARSLVAGIALASFTAACGGEAAPVRARVVIDPPRPLGPSLIATGTAPALFTWAPPIDRVDR